MDGGRKITVRPTGQCRRVGAGVPRKAEAIAQTHLLLRQHGKEICRDKSPQCYESGEGAVRVSGEAGGRFSAGMSDRIFQNWWPSELEPIRSGFPPGTGRFLLAGDKAGKSLAHMDVIGEKNAAGLHFLPGGLKFESHISGCVQAVMKKHVNPEFLEGGYLRDFDLSGTVVKMGALVLTAAAKYEHWNFPLLSTTPKTDVGISLQISYQPLHGLRLFKNN